MALVHKQAVNAQLLKGHHIILAALVVELLEPYLQPLARALHLLDGKPLAALTLRLFNRPGNIVDLAFQHRQLAFPGNGYLFKLRVPNDDGVVIPCGNAGTKLLSVRRLKIAPRRHQDICAGV